MLVLTLLEKTLTLAVYHVSNAKQRPASWYEIERVFFQVSTRLYIIYTVGKILSIDLSNLVAAYDSEWPQH